jgi:hypothetical protein
MIRQDTMVTGGEKEMFLRVELRTHGLASNV